MARRSSTELAFTALTIEGGLLAPDFLNKIAHLEAAAQGEADYDVPRGLKLRDEIGRYWKVAQNLWQDFAARRERADRDPFKATAHEFLEPFCRQVLGFADIRRIGQVAIGERSFPIGWAASDGRVPLVFAGHDQPLDKPGPRHGDGTRRRSPFLLAQEYLNANHAALWAVVSNGLKLRVLRDNPSLTRPAYVEADLEAIFSEGLYPDFAALWLFAHASRFGQDGAEPTDCPLEHWRNTAQEDGIRVRDRLRDGVAGALRVLGTGFLAHPANGELRRRIESGELATQDYFEQLLRLVYRFIFLATIEDRELVFAPDASAESRARYQAGYSLARLRRLAARRRSYDRHADLWQALTIAFAGLASGQPALGLPALGGLFHIGQCRELDAAQLDNQALLTALFGLCFFRDGAALSRVNYRDMDSEELGSVYESLLELVPEMTLTASVRRFGFIGDEEAGSTKGNARKLTGSYYTPDSLVQELVKSALDPVIARTLADNPRDPVAALLGLTVCDPACGSGHFLLAAARRIAEEVARLTAADGNPLPADYRHALRDVVAHCIYGVDRNPMAVELARTALWLEAYTPDRPLTFLDHHLRCGDALLGILDPAILEAGIPDKAFNALSGDDKEVVKALRKANRDALKSIEKAKAHAAFNLALGLDAAPAAAALDALPDDTLAALDAKRAAFAEAEARNAASRARLAADLFVAAFVLPKTPETARTVPTSQDLWLVLNGSDPRPGVAAAATRAAQTAQAFHWWQAFPQVRARGGFAVLLGNPPWERIKLQEEEYFASRSPLIAEAPHKAERGRRIELLREGMLLHALYPEVEAAQGLVPPNAAEQALFAEFLAARRNAEATSLFAHDSCRYPLSGVGDINVYLLFVETFLQLVSAPGRFGLIIPAGFSSDENSKLLFSEVMQTGRLVCMKSFENEDFIFPGVANVVRFSIVTILGTESKRVDPEMYFFLRSTSHASDDRRLVKLKSPDIKLFNPESQTCPSFRTQTDFELTRAIYSRFLPNLCGSYVDGDWDVKFLRAFDMSQDSSLFVEHALATESDSYLSLYEGKFIWHFDHRFSSYHNLGKVKGRGGRGLPPTSFAEYENPEFSIEPEYCVKRSHVEERLTASGWTKQWLFGFRDVTSSKLERTVVASIVPFSAVGHTMPLVLPNKVSANLVAALLANFNALVFDYVARQKVGGNHLTYGYLRQLPFIPRGVYSDERINFIVPRVLELTYTAHDLKPWAEDLGYEGQPYSWNAERRARLRAELDAYYARLYGMTRDELRYILDPADIMGADYPSETFRVLKNNETREHGEYRTRRLVLEAWDAQAGGG